ncbi:MAG: hypothetical protein GQ546_07500, partial [Gammaproteobacteria bacterium]|nr:hypothetical protein [Gammaproteobacteria bacterium]
MDNVNDASSANSASQSSDMSFYVIMLAIIVGMAFYISYDMEQRYGTSADNSSSIAVEPVVVSVKKVVTVEVKPVAEIPATETTPDAVVVEKTEKKTVVTTVVVPFDSGVIVIPAAEKAKVEEAKADVTKIEEVKVQAAKVEAAAPIVSDKVAEKTAPGVLPIVDTMMQTVEIMTEPAVEAAQAAADVVQSAPAQAAPAYNPYDYQYGRPYQGYQQPQQPQQYGNPYG